MITVKLTVGKETDCAEAEDPEAAVVAARQLWEDNRERGFYGCLRQLTFTVDGRIVRTLTRCP